MSEWRTMESAPKDGTPFIGGFYGIRGDNSHRVGDVVRCWWQPEFNAFISSCMEMVLADGYTFEDGSISQIHHPIIEPITCWMPLPQPPEGE